MQLIAGNWQISGIVPFQTGSYFTVVSGSDRCLCGAQGNNRANQVLGDDQVYATDRSNNQYLNPAAFAIPPTGQWGTAHINYIGPWELNINTALTRKFNVGENQTIEFRAEAFNLPNRVNLQNPGVGSPGQVNPPATNSVNNANFGKILGAKDPRIVQLALKYVF